MDEEGIEAGGKAGMSRKLVAGIIVAVVVAAGVGYIMYSQNDNNQIEIRDKTFLIGTYWWNGLNYQYANEFTAIFMDGSMYKISFNIIYNLDHDGEKVVFEGQNNRLTENEIRGLIYVLNTPIPNNTSIGEYDIIIYKSEKAFLSFEELNALTILIENSGFSSLNETYPYRSDILDSDIISTDLTWSWITTNYNNTYHKVICYNDWPTSFREIWDVIKKLENEKWR